VALGPDGALYVAEPDGNRIRRVVVDGANVGTVTTVAGTGAAGNQDGPGTSATFNGPIGLAVGPDRTIYVIEGNGARLRKIAPDGTVSTLAGTGAAGYVDGPGASAQFSAPNGIALDPDGSLYVADSGNDRIRKVTPTGQVTTLAGGGSDTGPATTLLAARVYHPVGVATTGDGYLYVTVGWGGRICKLRIR
jgi:sugar lactone lactonase YvrE